MATKNIQVVHVWNLGTTGEAANITATLLRYPDSSTQTSASETVTIAEIGVTGAYYVTFTPTSGSQVYTLQLVHDGGATPTYLEDWWREYVQDSPSTATVNDAYAAESDVAAYAQMGDYTASTKPTETQVTGFLADRAADVYGKLADIMGSDVTGPPSYSQAIDNSTDAGKALERAARKANAIGAAIDAVMAAGAGDSPGRSDRIAELVQMYALALDALEKPAVAYLGHPARSNTHIASGDVTIPSKTVYDQQGIVMDSNVEF